VDPFRQALIVEGGVRYQQTLVVRSYEVGPDKTATMETVLNLLQVRKRLQRFQNVPA
jgi:fatty acyl-ACP thioesterase B